MKNFSSLRQNKIAFSLSIIVAVFLVVSVASAVTTISTYIETAGALTVGGKTTLAHASTTMISSTGDVYVNGYATTTAATGAIATRGSLTVGPNGTALNQIVKGTCTLTNYGVPGTGIDVSQAASTTAVYQCATTVTLLPLSGVVSGDLTIVQFATTTAEIVNGWAIIGSSASSTDGYINVLVSNLTGIARVPSAAGVGSSTAYIVIH
jgi:hypothetical protein